MQLIDIVQLSIFIFSALILFILVISYTSYRIRTVTKKIAPENEETGSLNITEIKKPGLEDFGFEEQEEQKLIQKKRMEKFQVFNPTLPKVDSVKSRNSKSDHSKFLTHKKHFPRIILIDSVQ